MTFCWGHFCRMIYYIQNFVQWNYRSICHNYYVTTNHLKLQHHAFINGIITTLIELNLSICLTMVQSTRFCSVKHTKCLDVERTDPTHERFLHRILIALSLRVQPVDLSLSFLELLYMLTNTKLNVQIMSTSSNLLKMESLTPERQ